jgi:hypothetical protein
MSHDDSGRTGTAGGVIRSGDFDSLLLSNSPRPTTLRTMTGAPRFNVPPGWPIPQGWAPPAGWAPDPSWPPAPPGWQFWTAAAAAPVEYDYSSPHPAPGRSTTSPAAQAAISAAFLVPSVLTYYLAYDALSETYWQSSAATVVLELYLVVVVALWGRSTQRRISAAGLVVSGAIIDRVGEAVNINLLDVYSPFLFGISYIGMAVLFVAAWCVARRSSWLSATGLVATVGLAILAAKFYNDGHSLRWWQIWGIDLGVFVAGCLTCWAVDAVARNLRNGNTSQPLWPSTSTH